MITSRSFLLVLLATCIAARTSAQVVFQETFDSGLLSPGWVWQGDAPVLSTPDASGPGHCAGKESLNGVPPPPGEIGSFLFHDLPFSPGASYQVSLEMRVETTSMIPPGAACWIGWWGQGTVEDAVYVSTASSTWEYLQSGYGTPATYLPTPTLRFGIGLIVAASSVDAMAYFDDIEVTAFNFTSPAPVALQARAWLDGAFVPAQNLMRDDLRVAGLIPTTDPYGSAVSVAPAVLSITGNNAVVDWVRVELRIHPENGGSLASAAGLLQRDGDIVATDGMSALAFNVAPGTYHVVVKHRNHLDVMTQVPLTLTNTPTVLDLRAPATACYVRASPNNDQPRRTVGNQRTLWPGNVIGDDRVKYTGANNDRDPILAAIGGTVPTNTLTGQYRLEDVNLDGVVKYTGTANDRDIILLTIGGAVPTAVRIEQVP